MRIDVKKFLFLGLETDRLAFFKNAQDAGMIHFISPSKEKGKETHDPEINNYTNAIKILRSLPALEQESPGDYSFADDIVCTIINLKESLNKLSEEERLLHLEMTRVGVYGNFSSDDVAFIEKSSNRTIQYFFGKSGLYNKDNLPEELIYVNSDNGLDYFVGIHSQPLQYPKLVEMQIKRSLKDLQIRGIEITAKTHALENHLKVYAKYNTFIHQALVQKFNHLSLDSAQKEASQALDDSLFIISGWVPVNKLEDVRKLVLNMHVHAEEITIEPTDVIPTYLENKGAERLGEDLVHIYDTPSANDRDPSLWVLVSFALFFAIIVGDAGYGLLFLLAALYVRFRQPSITETKRRALNIVTILCCACIGWGLLTSSFFGMSLSPENPLRKFSAIQWLIEKKTAYHIDNEDETYTFWIDQYPEHKSIKDPSEFILKASSENNGNITYHLLNKFSDHILLELALVIGVLHVISSILRYLNRNWAGIGWIAFIIGGVLFIPYFLHATSFVNYVFGLNEKLAAEIGMYLIIGGLSVAMIISLFKNRLLGIFEVMTAVQIFADILSYLRLYALGLAGSIVSATINEGASTMPFVLGTLLILVGHGINMVLAIMSGTIHGLRLNFLEWYHYSFEGGGKLFKPLCKIKP